MRGGGAGPLGCDGRHFKKRPASFYINSYVCHPSCQNPTGK